tara:strand:+ start:2993 stop:5494 length:2502 start_codon:yes stop_codon:yes gene_type:complete
MLTDEQILQKATLLLEKTLNEMKPGEREHLGSWLYQNDPANLPFNDAFRGKIRHILPISQADNETETGKFVNLFAKMGYQVDWEKGMLQDARVEEDNSLEGQAKAVSTHIGPSGENPNLKTVKVNMKIGKWFAKVIEYITKINDMRAEVADRYNYPKYPEDAVKVLGEKRAKTLYFYQDRLLAYIRSNNETDDRKPFYANWVKDVGEVEKLAQYWKENASYLKKNADNLKKDDSRVMIVSRAPIDVARMGDFMKSYDSCHRPPSKREESDYKSNDQYKCAIAEAHGNGAIAFLVDKQAVLDAYDAETLEEVEENENFQKEEIFHDEDAYEESGPIEDDGTMQRLRLRLMKMYKAGDNPYEGFELAVPEGRVYLPKHLKDEENPVFIEKLVQWARQQQEDLMKKAPKTEGGALNLNDFIKFGGSWEDRASNKLVARLFAQQFEDFEGEVKRDTSTEDELELVIETDITAIQAATDETAKEWNKRYAACNVSGKAVEAYGDEGAVLVYTEGVIRLEWELDEWQALPNHMDMSHCVDDLLQSGYGTIHDPEGGGYSNAYLDGDSPYIGKLTNDKGREIIKAIIKIDPDKLIGWMKDAAMPEFVEVDDTYSFNYFCQTVDLIDDVRDNIKAGIEAYFKREGYIEGGQYIQLAMKIENGDIDPYEWDVEYDQEHYTDSYEAWAKVSYDYDPEALGVEPRILFDLVDERDFMLALRKYLTTPAREETGSEQWLMIRDKSAVDSGGDVRYGITFKVDADTPDKAVEQFYELVTGEMDDEDEISKAFMSALQEVAQKNGVKLNGDSPAPEKVRDFEALQDLGENKQYNANYLVKTWKRFIL